MQCPKCGRDLPFADPDETPEQLSRMCAEGYGTSSSTICPYVACDDVNCRAKQFPDTLEEWKAAATHWRYHHVNYGCSHGC